MGALLTKKAAQDWLMQGMRTAISRLPAATPDDLELRLIAEQQFRRVEKLFGYEQNSWSAGV